MQNSIAVWSSKLSNNNYFNSDDLTVSKISLLCATICMQLSKIMNVLILTPDAVGSTFLQRVVTIYMQLHNFDRPVINLHELTNGIVKYYNPEFGREVLGKKQDKWGYYQSLEQVVEILSSVDHYKTSRLALYHIKNRGDSLADQVQFYQYLRDNFYIISCRRENLFEHAISWGINKITNRLNVYSHDEKIDSFYDLYRTKLEIDVDQFVRHLDNYEKYIYWCDQYFSVTRHFVYERDLPNIEQFVLNLPVFVSQTNMITWEKTFGISFNDWNRCHRIASDIGTLALTQATAFPQLTVDTTSNTRSNSLISCLPAEQQDFFARKSEKYYDAVNSIDRMRELGILVTSIPIKKQTLEEKRYLIKNFDQLIDTYNIWISLRPELGSPVNADGMQDLINKESQTWKPVTGSLTVT